MANYPLSNFHFQVDWGGRKSGFTEVSGLSIEVEVLEYREGNSLEGSAIKLPGLRKFSNIVLKRGIVEGDNDFYNWINTVQQNKVERRDVSIMLLNEANEPVRVWRVRGAWPCKMQANELKANGNEIAIEVLELAHEGLEVDNI